MDRLAILLIIDGLGALLSESQFIVHSKMMHFAVVAYFSQVIRPTDYTLVASISVTYKIKDLRASVIKEGRVGGTTQVLMLVQPDLRYISGR